MDILSKIFKFICFLAIIATFQSVLAINSFSTLSKTITLECQNKTSQSDTYTVRVFHDGYWWIQVYDNDSDHLVYEYLDPIQD